MIKAGWACRSCPPSGASMKTDVKFYSLFKSPERVWNSLSTVCLRSNLRTEILIYFWPLRFWENHARKEVI